MSINRNSYWGCCSTPKPGPSLSPTQPLESPQGHPWNGYLQTSPAGGVHCLLCPLVWLLAPQLPCSHPPMPGFSDWPPRS